MKTRKLGEQEFNITEQCSATFFLPMAHPTVAMAHGGTPQNLALWKQGTKQYVATKNASPMCKPLSYIH
jgi:hypothetical protein